MPSCEDNADMATVTPTHTTTNNASIVLLKSRMKKENIIQVNYRQ